MTVVGVAGVSGAGKSCLVRRLAEHYGAPSLFFDHYRHEIAPDTSLHGKPAGLPAVACPELTQKLAQYNGQWVFVEAPFGRAHVDFGGQLDLVLAIDIPLEVALARRLSRYLAEGRPAVAVLRSLALDLQAYESEDRPIYVATRNALRERADLLLDGMGAPEALVAQAIAFLEAS